MSWLIPAAAVLLVLAIIRGARSLIRRTRMQEAVDAELRSSSQAIDILQPESRVQQFRRTGTHRLPEPRSTATDLRPDVQNMLADADMSSDLKTLDLRKWDTKGIAFIDYEGASGKGRIRIDGLTYGGFKKDNDEPAERLMRLIRSRFSGEIIEYAAVTDSQSKDNEPTPA